MNTSPLSQYRTAVLPTDESRHVLTPLGMEEVTFTSGFWARMQQMNASGIIPHALAWEKKIGWIDNFVRAAAGTIAGHHAGLWFADSDVYKLIEAMAWELGRLEAAQASGGVGNQETGTQQTGTQEAATHESGKGADAGTAAMTAAELEEEIQRLGAMIEAVQDEDGYLNTRYGKPGTEERYSNFVMGHELYCTGHLAQAAVARLRTGRGIQDVIVRIALRNAEHVCATFGADGLEAICGHPEVEVALVELFRATGERRYLDQAQLFLDRRGHGILGHVAWGAEYFQDDTPIREETVARGHAVRALYLMAGAIDAAMERGDDELLKVVRAQYDRTLARRTYITGGMGSRHDGEAFGDDFELPSDRSYCETCAGIASIMVAWRLLLATGENTYADVIERTLYNVVAASPAADGRSFFYANPLQVRVPGEEAITGELSLRSGSSLRASWFEVSCCPTNIARTLASLGGACVTRRGNAFQVHHLAAMRVRTTTDDGQPLEFSLSTDYPSDGRIRLRIDRAPSVPVSLAIRIPTWARGDATVDGRVIADAVAAPGIDSSPAGVGEEGYAVIRGLVRDGEEHVIEIPLQPRILQADPRIDALRGQVAVEYGPLVMCAESVDLPDGWSTEEIAITGPLRVWRNSRGELVIPVTRVSQASPVWAYTPVTTAGAGVENPGTGQDGEDNGDAVLQTGIRVGAPNSGGAGQAQGSQAQGDEVEMPLRPYYTWGNRGPATMRVWLPVS